MRHKFLLEIVVFFSGALVMIYEIIGSRILAPYIGTSTYVWTSLIGVILASLSLGYYLGGKLADRQPQIAMLAGIMLAAGAMLSLTILLQNFVLAIISTSALGLEFKSILAALILFAPTSVLFGLVTPYAVRLKLETIENVGQTVGRLYALSTAGSILGTFAAGFFLLPFVGSIRTLYLLAGIAFALALLLAPFAASVRNIFVLLLFPLAVGFNEFYAYTLRQSFNWHDFDTQYNRLQVENSTDKYTGKPTRVLLTDPRSTQSAMFLESDELVLRYAKFYHLLRHFKPDFQRTLIIGGAAYSFPKEYLRVYPQKQIDVVEIDPQMTQIARDYFRLKDNANLRIFHADGRVFLNQTAPQQYDVMLLDAFNSLYSVPFQLTTIEAVGKMNNGLSANGVVILNLISSIEGDNSLFLQAEYQTFAAVFPNVLIFQVNAEKTPATTQNLILLASKSANISLATDDVELKLLFKNRYEKPLAATVPILRDDLAPVEYYNSLAQKSAEATNR